MFFTMVPNICESSVHNLLHVTFLAPRIMRRHLDLWKTCASLIWPNTLNFFEGIKLFFHLKYHFASLGTLQPELTARFPHPSKLSHCPLLASAHTPERILESERLILSSHYNLEGKVIVSNNFPKYFYFRNNGVTQYRF